MKLHHVQQSISTDKGKGVFEVNLKLYLVPWVIVKVKNANSCFVSALDAKPSCTKILVNLKLSGKKLAARIVLTRSVLFNVLSTTIRLKWPFVCYGYEMCTMEAGDYLREHFASFLLQKTHIIVLAVNNEMACDLPYNCSEEWNSHNETIGKVTIILDFTLL